MSLGAFPRHGRRPSAQNGAEEASSGPSGKPSIEALYAMVPPPSEHATAWWLPVWELVVHVMVGSLLFAVIFTPAIALDWLVRFLEDTLKISEYLVVLLTGTKYVVATIDAGLYIIFMLNMGWVFVRKLQWMGQHHG